MKTLHIRQIFKKPILEGSLDAIVYLKPLPKNQEIALAQGGPEKRVLCVAEVTYWDEIQVRHSFTGSVTYTTNLHNHKTGKLLHELLGFDSARAMDDYIREIVKRGKSVVVYANWIKILKK